MNDTPEQIEATIAALESQRALLGDAVVESATAPLRLALAALRPREPAPGQQLERPSSAARLSRHHARH